MNFPRTLVVGIDGATFDLIKPWAKAGLLPTFAHLLQHGAHATLDAYPYLNSAAAWTNFVTGYNPGQHGIFDFTNQAKSTWRPTGGADRSKPAFWHLLAAGGQRVGVMNVPISFPAEQTNGFMVSGMDSPAPDRKGFTQPEGLYQELRRAGIAYEIDVPNLAQTTKQKVMELPRAVRDMTLARTRAFLYLLEKYPCDAAMLVYVGSDRMSHYFWSETPPAPGAPEWKPLRELLQLYDAQLEQLLARATSDTTVFVVSDHGFGVARHAYLGMNPLLERLGYQTRRTRPSQATVLGNLLRIGRRTVPGRWQKGLALRFPRAHTRASRSDKQGEFDWSRTRAFAHLGNHVRINSRARYDHGIVPAEEYDALCLELRDVLCALTDPESGAPLMADVYRRDAFYHGPHAYLAADLVGKWIPRNVRHALAYRRSGHDIVIRPGAPANGWRGTHLPEGIFIAYGKGIRGGVAHPPLTHLELTPTLLYLHDQPVPADMDGRVLTEWFEPAFSASRPIQRGRAVEYRPAGDALNDAENQVIENRLRHLGYIE